MGSLFAILGFIFNIKLYLMIGALSIALGVGALYLVQSKWHDAVIIHQLHKADKTSAKNLVKSEKKSQAIEARIRKRSANIDRIKAAAANRIEKQKERTYDAPSIDSAMPSADYRLDVGTVRLLNAARQGAPLESASGSDATLSAPSTVGVDKLVDNDLEVVKRYHDLATRHDSLVDYVEKKMRDQAHAQ